jgi:hypothetical protein
MAEPETNLSNSSHVAEKRLSVEHQFCNAAKCGNVEELRRLLALGVNVNAADRRVSRLSFVIELS